MKQERKLIKTWYGYRFEDLPDHPEDHKLVPYKIQGSDSYNYLIMGCSTCQSSFILPMQRIENDHLESIVNAFERVAKEKNYKLIWPEE